MAGQYRRTAGTALSTERNQSAEVGHNAASRRGSLLVAAPLQTDLWQTHAGPASMLFLQAQDFSLFQANPSRASDLTTFE